MTDKRQVKIGDTIGLIQRVISDKDGKGPYWRLIESSVTTIRITAKGRKVKARRFYAIDAEEVECNTDWLNQNDKLILVKEPFILSDELRVRCERWIENENRMEKKDSENVCNVPTL